MSERTEFDAIMEHAEGTIRKVEATPMALVPAGWQVKELEHLLAAPIRHRGQALLDDPASLAAYVNLHKGVGTRAFAQLNPAHIRVFLDHHRPDAPAWCEHVAQYQPKPSREWETWLERDARKQTQVAFAEFLEDNLPDVADPDGATLLEVCSSLQSKRKVAFQSGVRLNDGTVQLAYQEETESTTSAKGHLTVPERFVLGIPVFEHGAKYRLDARLRWRIDSETHALSFHYILERPEAVLEQAFGEDMAVVAAGTGLEILRGSFQTAK